MKAIRLATRAAQLIPAVRRSRKLKEDLAKLKEDLAKLKEDLAKLEAELKDATKSLQDARLDAKLFSESLFPIWLQRGQEYKRRVQNEAPQHLSSWKPFEELTNRTDDRYCETYDLSSCKSDYLLSLLNAKGGMLGLAHLVDMGIEGFLSRTEALKLYEMGYFSKGDILELGTHKGLSTSILAHALHDRGTGAIQTIDIDEATNAVAKANLTGLPGVERVNFMVANAMDGMDQLACAGRVFDFIFVDHWHGYAATHDVASRIPKLLSDGGHVMFHDFFDAANADPDHVYGVYQAVIDTLGKDPRFIFAGAAGGSAIFKRITPKVG